MADGKLEEICWDKAPDTARSSSWPDLRLSRPGAVVKVDASKKPREFVSSDSIGVMDSELTACGANWDFST
jgi:hypothetical protein